jgi:phosphoribosyl-AMP cyclohydrolase / phosphoribosyl-ATP pyrophosphohydrolase
VPIPVFSKQIKLPGSVFEFLQDFIDKRKQEMPEGSIPLHLFQRRYFKISQKVGEEAVETIIGAMANDDENFIYEAGDLLYHLIVLLSHKGYRLEDVVGELKKRHK